MFEYFPKSYPLSLAIGLSIGMGGEMSEIDEASRPLNALPAGTPQTVVDETWFTNWMKLGDKLTGQAHEDNSRGWKISSGEKLLRACNYYLFAERIASWSDPRRSEAYARGRRSFAEGVALAGHATERVEVPYENGHLAGYLALPAGAGPHPALIFYNGFDSIKEMHYLIYARIARARGIAVLFVDQEGTGEAVRLHSFPKRHDIEKSAGLFIDALEARPDIDPGRIGVIGISMGGYDAPRAAAFDPRLKCAISLGAFYQLDSEWVSMLAGDDEGSQSDGLPESGLHAMKVTQTGSVGAAIEALQKRNLEGILDRIQVPLLVVHGENDRQVRLWHGERTAKEAVNSPRAELKVFTIAEGSSEHCGLDILSMTGQYCFDWAAEILNPQIHAVPAIEAA